MWNPINASWENLLSYRTGEFEFSKNRLTLIQGVNRDDDGANSNGAGKSVIFEALTILLTNEPYRDVDKEDFIRDGEDTCFVSGGFEHSITKQRLKIERWFKRKGSAKVKVYLNDIWQEQLTSVKEHNEFILDLIGITKQDLLDYYIINQGNSNSFFTSGDTRQKEIISRFANFNSIDNILENLKKQIKEKEADKHLCEKDIRSHESAINTLQEELEFEIEENNKEVEDESEGLLEEQKDNNRDIKTLEEDSEYATDKSAKVKAELEKLNLEIEEFQEIEETLSTARTLIRDTNDKIGEYETKESKIKRALKGAIECPSCQHEFLLDNSGKTLAELQDDLKLVQKRLKKQNKILDDYEQVLKDTKELLKGREKLEKQARDLKSKLSGYNESLSYNSNRIKRLIKRNKEIDNLLQSKKEVKRDNSKVKSLEERIERNQAKLKHHKQSKAVIQEEIEALEFWLLHFGKKGFQSFLANKTITVINNFINQSLHKLYTNLSVKITGFTKLKSGDVREKIDIFIVKDNVVSGRYGKYSGGEKGRINICGIITLHRLMNLSTEGKGLNFLGLDENFEGLDFLGQKEILRILELNKVTTLVITHNNIEEINDIDKIFIEKENGCSRIVKR